MKNAPDPDQPALPPDLRFLKALVTILTGTMVVGLITLVVLFVTRFPAPPANRGEAFDLPESILVPDGQTATAVTYTADRIIVLTESDQVLVYRRSDGRLLGALALTPPQTE